MGGGGQGGLRDEGETASGSREDDNGDNGDTDDNDDDAGLPGAFLMC